VSLHKITKYQHPFLSLSGEASEASAARQAPKRQIAKPITEKTRTNDVLNVSTISTFPSSTTTGTCLVGDPSLKLGLGLRQLSKNPFAGM
jgi:hypothetical protein